MMQQAIIDQWPLTDRKELKTCQSTKSEDKLYQDDFTKLTSDQVISDQATRQNNPSLTYRIRKNER